MKNGTRRRIVVCGLALAAVAGGVGRRLTAQTATAPSRPWSCWMMAGAAQAVFANAITDAGCTRFAVSSSGIRIGLSPGTRVALPIVVPGSPTGLSASTAGQTVTFSWAAPTAGDPAITYVVEAGSASGRSDLFVADTGSAAPALVATAVPAGTYFVRVRARNASGTSRTSNETRLTVSSQDTCAVAPGPPTGLVSTVSGSSVSLTWQAPAGGCAATSYILEAGSAAGLTNLATIPTGSASTTFSASGVAPGTYFVRVRSSNATGTSSSTSNEVSLTVGSVPCTGVPGAPTNLAGVVTGTTVSLSWVIPSTGCSWTSFFLEAGSAAAISDLAAFSTGSPTPSFIATAVPNGTYYVRVRSENALGRSGVSNEVILTVGGAPSSWTAEGIRLTNALAGFSGVIADTSTLLLNDGRYRMFVFTGNAYRSAISSDGLAFTMEAGTRLPEGYGHIRVLRLDDGRVRAFAISGAGIASAISSDEGLTFTIEPGERIAASAARRD